MSAAEESPQKRRRLLVALVPLAVFAALAGIFLMQLTSGRDNSTIPSALIGKAAPQTALPPLEGSGLPGLDPANFAGKVTLVNIWASWCAPCRAEMPALDQLQKDMGSDKFEVVAVNVDKNGFDKAREFLKGIDVKSLALYADPTARAASQVKALGMPATLLVDKEGHEIGRLMGPAEWDSPEAKRLIEAALR